ncbi:DUF732 domain-containing protein [Mycobacterium conspicuum]|uniref:DUF732 domain-containing protein n=1 Tax=Mycobacterium conspicuum TaxID=44010 RepID=UPI000A14C2C9|nr:DUF732 domain-containing protein [Mycobacterium conspicuum]ORV37318.1 glycine cleavage system P protein [Mycobacterium conspicuum]
MVRQLVPLLGVAALIGFAAPAYADPGDGDDASFLAALNKVGISYASPAQAVTSGRAVCECLSNGESGLELVHDVKTHNPGMDMENASNFAMISAKFFCPDQLSKA